MTKTSQWAGYCASVFAIAFFVTALEFRGSGGQVPGWFAVVTGWFMMLAAFSGVVCLVSAVFGFIRGCGQDTNAVTFMTHSTAKAIVDKHEQRYCASCSSSAIEMVLKIHGKLPLTDYSLQDKYQNQNVGFGPFAGQVLHGVTFAQDSDAPPFTKLKGIIASEHAAGRCVVVSTREPHGGFHIWIATEPDSADARAPANAEP